ncbi:ABC transporter permease [Aliiruegeria sabulilitoris]|uniref:ABC transporter permease n=1 Tax=Aliiruegeria sabulilitoris TaxID=1510458 RepID=UPI0008296D43|nr:ABC transporter permease [Aliiruegeria sabulilitoris]NDR55432.1 ABC transporter permease [Pseudoruegeria sp. M32A2M]
MTDMTTNRTRPIGVGIGLNTLIIIGLFGATLITVSIFAEGFFSVRNFSNVLYQVSALGFLVLGITPVIIIGHLDLSLVALMTVSAIIGTLVISVTGSTLLGVVVILAVGAAVGAFNGFFIGKMKVVSFIVTLAMMIVGGGVAAYLTKSVTISSLPDAYFWIGGGKIGIIPVPFLIFSAFVAVGLVILNRTYFGRWLYSIGNNEQAARVAGIPVERVILYVFIVAGLMAAMSGIVQSSKLGYASASMIRTGTLVNYIAAATIGGVSIRGGKGNLLFAVFGAFVIVTITNACTFLGVGYYEQLIIKGVIIVGIVALDQLALGQTRRD